MSVLFPAPFSPQSAWTSPRSRSRETPSSARTPGKSLVIDLSSRRAKSGSGRFRPRDPEGHVAAAGDPRPRALEAREPPQRSLRLAGRDAAVERAGGNADEIGEVAVLAERRPGGRVVHDQRVDAPALEAVEGLLFRDPHRAFPQ